MQIRLINQTMPDNHPYNTSLRIQHIGPHENANLQISMGEKGPFKVGVFATNGSGKTTLSRQFRLQRLQNDLKDDESLPDAAAEREGFEPNAAICSFSIN